MRKCDRVVRMFGAYWDDEITQAEREWVDAHLAGCPPCRQEYEAFARTLELAGSLPRIEPAPDLVERVLARARRAAPAPDMVPATARPWVPATAALALVVIAGALSLPWLGNRTEPGRESSGRAVVERVPSRVEPLAASGSATPGAPAANSERERVAVKAADAVPDSLFDHSEDVEFILDPVRLQRGRATVTRPPAVQGEKAVLSF